MNRLCYSAINGVRKALTYKGWLSAGFLTAYNVYGS